MKRGTTTLATCLLLVLIGGRLHADITVTIEAPQLGSGMAQLQTMLEQAVATAADSLADVADSYLAKPLLMAALAGANATGTLPAPVSVRAGDVASVSLGCYAAVQTDTWDLAVISERIEGFQIEDDYDMGAGVRPLALDLMVPLGFVLRGLGVRFSGGFMQAEVQGYTFTSASAGAFVDYTVLRPRLWSRAASWQGLTVGLGASYGENRLATVVAPGLIEQTLSFDADGSGPLPALSVDVQVDPEIALTVTSSAAAFPLSLRSGITLFDALSLSAGGGADLSMGSTAVGVDGDPEIVVLGYLSGLIDEPGRIVLSGSVAQGYGLSLRAFAFADVLFRAGPYYLAVSALYRYPGGLAAGASLGVSLR